MGISRPLSISRISDSRLKDRNDDQNQSKGAGAFVGGHKERRIDHSDQVADSGLCSQSEEEPGISLYSKVHYPPAALGLVGHSSAEPQEQPARMGKVRQDKGSKKP